MAGRGHCAGAAFGWAKIWNSEIGCFWRIGVCIADSDILHPLTLPQFCQCSTIPHKVVCTPRNQHCWSDWTFTCCKTAKDPYCPATVLQAITIQCFGLPLKYFYCTVSEWSFHLITALLATYNLLESTHTKQRLQKKLNCVQIKNCSHNCAQLSYTRQFWQFSLLLSWQSSVNNWMKRFHCQHTKKLHHVMHKTTNYQQNLNTTMAGNIWQTCSADQQEWKQSCPRSNWRWATANTT